MIVFSPTPALADVCTGRSQPGITVTVAGQPVRIPGIEVEVCRDIGTATVTPTPSVVTSGYPCDSACLAIVIDWGSSSADQNVTVSYSIDGSGTSRTIDLPISNASDPCIFGVGFPSPPVGGCLISVDPDDF
jgi:hypothetical protein